MWLLLVCDLSYSKCFLKMQHGCHYNFEILIYIVFLICCLCVVAAEEPVAMDTDNIQVAVMEGSDFTTRPLESVTSTVAMACTVPDSSVCLLAAESAMAKDTLEDVGLDLTETFSLGNVQYFIDDENSLLYSCSEKKFISTKLARCVRYVALPAIWRFHSSLGISRSWHLTVEASHCYMRSTVAECYVAARWLFLCIWQVYDMLTLFAYH